MTARNDDSRLAAAAVSCYRSEGWSFDDADETLQADLEAGRLVVEEVAFIERLVAALRQTEPCDGLSPLTLGHCPGTEYALTSDLLCRRCAAARDAITAARAKGYGGGAR